MGEQARGMGKTQRPRGGSGMSDGITQLPDGSAFFTATILSNDEARALPIKDRLPADLYYAVFETVGHASMCWNPRPSTEVFDCAEASNAAVALCFKIAEALEARALPIKDRLPADLYYAVFETVGHASMCWNP